MTTENDHSSDIKIYLAAFMWFSTYLGIEFGGGAGRAGGGGGGSPGIDAQPTTCFLQFFTLHSSKMEASHEAYFFDIVTTQNDHPSNVKDVLSRIYVFGTLFGVFSVGGGRVFPRIGAQHAYAIFSP